MSRHFSNVKIHSNLIPNAHSSREGLILGIKAEPMFFRANAEFAADHGDLLTQDFLNAAIKLWGAKTVFNDCIIDSRSHMLMPGMVPCIPGWHTDDAPRSKDYCDGQPNIFTPEYETDHLLCVIDAGTGSLTEFLDGPVTVPKGAVENAYHGTGANFYKTVDGYIESGVTAQDCKRVKPISGDVVEFNVHSWHRGVPAKARGFRWFIRITKNSRHKVENELRSNAQVYITDTSYGW